MSLAHYFSNHNRRRKWELFLKEFSPAPAATVLDVGFTNHEYSPTDNWLEKNYPHPNKITALSVEPPQEFSARYPLVKTVTYSGGAFPFASGAFDIVWSNAVLEHVGSKQEQIMFLSEIKRVAKRAFITTPNRWFPLEVHTKTPLLHWLPKKYFDSYLRLVGQSWAAGSYMSLLSEKDLRARLSEAGILEYQIIRNRVFGFTVDFVVIF